jgi:hypothetical protein
MRDITREIVLKATDLEAESGLERADVLKILGVLERRGLLTRVYLTEKGVFTTLAGVTASFGDKPVPPGAFEIAYVSGMEVH